MRSPARIGLIWSVRQPKKIATMIMQPMTSAMENSNQRSTARAPSTGMQIVLATLHPNRC